MMVSGNPIAARTFSVADQLAFARASGDRNPMHLDETRSRRTMAGAPAVHGVHGALWALETLAAAGVPLADTTTLKAQFAKFVYLDQGVSLRIARRSELALKAELATEAGTVTTLNLKLATPRSDPSPSHVPDCIGSDFDEPRNLKLDDMYRLEGVLTAPSCDEIGRLFPTLCAVLGENRVQSLVLLSTLVGMVCPGLHSIFAGFEVEFLAGDQHAAGLSWRTARVDERFRKIAMAVRGAGFEGEVQAFARPEPVEPPRMAELAGRVSPGEFSDRTALVLGGARGLGAVTAKLLAAGGARVIATYANGRDEVEALVADISAMGGRASALSCDVTGDLARDLRSTASDVTHLYYFATPRIGGQDKAKVFSQERFELFSRFYVDGFLEAVSCLADREGSALKRIFYPSTIFLDERPRGMTEYAMAKAAGEVLAKDLGEAFGVGVSIPRIPKLLTDQTIGLLAFEAEDAVDVMLRFLRHENSLSDGPGT